ncbi:MAG: Type I secretion system, outer membrane component LapE [uncultured Sulfurovum sp.]|uniref:Type I secretion system, outer membrane component LapE n=1 Tax=uncultured Sulfurovum sp. TaxID=269237 RepID=A0A6S6RZK2_9BACT|nr:MAG: Type I secretion system, outer membrane component LapE [uncultured Sulfurovum sp.]
MFVYHFRYILLTLLLSLSSIAEELKNLSLDNALTIMQENNLELKISNFDEQMRQYEVNVAKGHNYGKLDAKIQALRSNDAGNIFGFKLKSREATFGDFGFSEFDMSGQTNPLPVAPQELNYPDSRNHFQTTITYMLPLYTGGKLEQYGKITKALQRMSQLDSSKVLNEKVYQTTKTFYDISLIDQYINNLSNILSNIDTLQNIVSSMKEEGFAKEIDELEVETRRAEASSMLTQANYNKELAYQYLSFLLNKNVLSIQALDNVASMPTININEFLKNNLDIQKAELGLKITDMAVEAEEANFLPTVGAFGEYVSSDDKAFNDFIDKDFYTVGVQLEWNLYNGNIDKNNLAKAKVQNMKVKEQVELTQKGIGLKIAKLQTEANSKAAEITSLETQFSFASKVYENYQERYKEGITSISDVLIKQSKELEVLLKLLTAKNDRNAKVFELRSILNKGNK